MKRLVVIVLAIASCLLAAGCASEKLHVPADFNATVPPMDAKGTKVLVRFVCDGNFGKDAAGIMVRREGAGGGHYQFDYGKQLEKIFLDSFSKVELVPVVNMSAMRDADDLEVLVDKARPLNIKYAILVDARYESKSSAHTLANTVKTIIPLLTVLGYSTDLDSLTTVVFTVVDTSSGESICRKEYTASRSCQVDYYNDPMRQLCEQEVVHTHDEANEIIALFWKDIHDQYILSKAMQFALGPARHEPSNPVRDS